MYGITGSISTPAVMPFLAKYSIPLNRSLVNDTKGSIFLHVLSSAQVMEKLTLAGACFLYLIKYLNLL